MSKAVSIFCIILGLVLLAGMAFGIYVLLEASDYLRSLPTGFYVTVDGNRYNGDCDELILSDPRVEVHYLVEWLSRKQGYSYKIVPTGEDFSYWVDGNAKSFSSIEDLTSAFEISKQGSGFTIKCKGKSLADVLQVLNPGSELVVPTSEDSNFHYKLVISSVDGKSISLTFRCPVGAGNIELDPPAIIF